MIVAFRGKSSTLISTDEWADSLAPRRKEELSLIASETLGGSHLQPTWFVKKVSSTNSLQLGTPGFLSFQV